MTAPILAFYGDDLTGSTDVLEALTLRGVRTVLFTAEPSPSLPARFTEMAAIGLAGTSRSETPDWMDANLPGAFGFLAATGAPLCHYKVCSTFDSAPAIGSIGRALEIGRRVFGQRTVPIVVGAPELRRWTVFAHLFAAYGDTVHRIDRHPVMHRHPVTPMDEADLRRHLARQTALPIGHVNHVELGQADADAIVDARADGAAALFLDVADATSQRAAGRQLCRLRDQGSRFVIGSSGVEYALATTWGAPRAASAPALAPVDRIAIVSGSVSPTTERQIRHAEAAGFVTIPVDPLRLVGATANTVDAAVAAAVAALERGRSPILFTALGPAGDAGLALAGQADARHAIGRALGDALLLILNRTGIRRAAIAGGDTSSHALRRMGIGALTVRHAFPATPGSPLCTAHAEAAALQGIEIALKGGQIGGDNYFVALRDGAG